MLLRTPPFCSRLLHVAPDLTISPYTPPRCSGLSHFAPDSSTLLHLALLLLHLAPKSSTSPKLTDTRFFKTRAQHTSWDHVCHTPHFSVALCTSLSRSDVPALHLALEFLTISVFLTICKHRWLQVRIWICVYCQWRCRNIINNCLTFQIPTEFHGKSQFFSSIHDWHYRVQFEFPSPFRHDRSESLFFPARLNIIRNISGDAFLGKHCFRQKTNECWIPWWVSL